MTKTTWAIEIASDLAVVGYNPENADMDRPRGEIIDEVFYLRATTDRGDAREFGSYRSVEAAEKAIEFAPPVLLWHDARPVYGSQAYVQDGGDEEMLAWEARHQEYEDWGFDTRFAVA